jgi:hypothetical protein
MEGKRPRWGGRASNPGRGAWRSGWVRLPLLSAIVAASIAGMPCSAASSDPDRWHPPLFMAWDWQLAEPHDYVRRVDMMVLDLFESDEKAIRQLRRAGAKLACEFSAGVREQGRPDFDRFPEKTVGFAFDSSVPVLVPVARPSPKPEVQLDPSEPMPARDESLAAESDPMPLTAGAIHSDTRDPNPSPDGSRDPELEQPIDLTGTVAPDPVTARKLEGSVASRKDGAATGVGLSRAASGEGGDGKKPEGRRNADAKGKAARKQANGGNGGESKKKPDKKVKAAKGDAWLDVREMETFGPVIERRLDLCVRKGFFAVVPNHLDAYLQTTGFDITYEDQIRYNRWFADLVHQRGLSVGMRNGAGMIDDLVDYYDWILVEGCIARGWCDRVLPFAREGKAIFAIEYLEDQVTVGQVCSRARELGLNAIIKRRERSEWLVPCY